MRNAVSKFEAFLLRHPEFRSGLRVAVYTFLASFGLSLMGFLSDVSSWATGEDIPFPEITPLGKAAAAGAVSALSGLIAFGYNKLPKTASAQYTPSVPVEPADPPPDPLRRDRG